MKLFCSIAIIFTLILGTTYGQGVNAVEAYDSSMEGKHNWNIEDGKYTLISIDCSKTGGETRLSKSGKSNGLIHYARFGNKTQQGMTTVIVKPAIPFRPGQTYDFFIDGKLFHRFTCPSLDLPEMEIDIFPHQDSLPANQLMFHLHSNIPLSVIDPYSYIHFFDHKGDSLPTPFLKIEPPLVSEDQTRLTLWLDPGRIKRELNLNQKYGVPLQEGQMYELRLSRELSGIHGGKLEKEASKFFFVTKADRIKPRPFVHIPEGNSSEPLLVDFGEAMDVWTVKGEILLFKNGKLLDMTFEADSQGKSWEGLPKGLWEAGQYEVRIASSVQDLAGNNLTRLFDEDLKKAPSAEGATTYSIKDGQVIIPFVLK